MGKIPQGILGGVSGSIGGVVGSSWKGINVIKTKPLSVANPRTAGQVAQRSKFSNTVGFAVQILAILIKPLWDRFASRMSGYNAFVSNSIEYFTDLAPALGSGFKFAKGKMATTAIAVTSFAEGDQTLCLSWLSDSGVGYKLDTDRVMVLKFKPGNELAEGFAPAVTRVNEVIELDMITHVTEGEVFVIQVAFLREDGTVVGNAYEVEATVTA